jgi:hypothetical protein
VPIAVPAYHGLEPKLKLSYSSAGGNGLAGVGWGLSGISYIERGLPGGGSPKYDANDAYFLDGMELIPSTLQGGTHCTKIQNYTRIVQDGNYWYVYGTNGNLATYQPIFVTSKGTFRWYLTSIEDTHGNVVNYIYWNDSNLSVYLNTITYNGTTIRFYLETRPDIVTFATGVGMGKVQYRLKSVDVQTGSNRLRAYGLIYAGSTATSRSLLVNVQQFGNDAVLDVSGSIISGTTLPPYLMDYSINNLPAFGDLTLGLWGNESKEPQIFTGDYNGDGKIDILCLLKTSTGDYDWRLRLSNGSSFGDLTLGLWANESMEPQIFTGDYNGDGKTDILCLLKTST